jgi:hypothetical protein
MIWLTWRQFRAAATMMAAALAALAAILALTGPGVADDYATGIAACTQSGCSDFVRQFFNHHQGPFLAVTAVVLVLPALIGLFWGAPLITRELEAGTHRLVWNQSITRTRWLAVKLALTGLAAMTAAGLGSLAVTWWSGPIDKTAANFPKMGPLLFDARGIVPIAYAAFAFALGVTVGMLVRRTCPPWPSPWPSSSPSRSPCRCWSGPTCCRRPVRPSKSPNQTWRTFKRVLTAAYG